MYLYGASGHAKVIIDLLEECGTKVDGLFDDNPEVHTLQGYKVEHRFTEGVPLIISIGSNRIRKIVDRRIHAVYGTAIHPRATVSKRATVREGSVVMAGAVVQADASIGRHCIVNTGASVDHECRVGDFVHLSPHSTLCGNVSVGEGTWIGAGSTVIQGVTIGKWCVIGAGSVVSKDIPDGTLYVGNRQTVSRRCYQNIVEEMNNIGNMNSEQKQNACNMTSTDNKRGGVKP